MAEPWHSLDVEASFARLASSPAGLSKGEAAERLTKEGPNELAQTSRVSPLRIFLEQFTDVLVVILIVAAAISGYLGISRRDSTEVWDAVLIAVIVVLNAGLGFVQEYRAEKSLQALKALAAPKAHAVRQGEVIALPSRDLVPGDVVLLATGDQVPADLRLVEVASLRIDEASLTGESTPVTKAVAPLPVDAFLGDRRNLAFVGTTVEGGRGRGLVVGTGMRTELGKIAGLVQQETKEETPLQRQLDRLGRQIGLAILGIAAVVFVLMFLREADPLGNIELLFLTAVGLAVAAIPEGLPAVVTISLALGLQRMIRRHALVRKLPAVEALGAATVICADKTGTLTKGEMNVRAVFAGGRAYEVRGEGFDPAGEIVVNGQPVLVGQQSDLREALVCGVLCNDAMIRKEADRWMCDGDPTEGALVVAAMRAGLDADVLRSEQPRVAELAFSSERKRMSTLHAPLSAQALHEILAVSEDRRHLSLAEIGAKMLYVKGAPERILAACSHHLVGGERKPLTDYDRKQYAFENQEMATRALRVLGLASRSFPGEVPPLREGGLESDLTFLGLVGMMDAPRQDAIAAVGRCKQAGIDVVMITGDHKLTAMAVAREMGILAAGDRALTGEELDKVSEDDLVRDVERVKVYARVSPEHKMRIVDAWKRKGHVVAMTGDGVNDAPALKRADLGVAMGITGTDVAKESADMVLTDDNFASIVAAVEEGRGIYENIRKFVAYLLSANAGEVLIMLLATLLVLDPAFLPFFTPVQLLWINLVTDGMPALALGLDPYPPDIMTRRPRNPREGVLSKDIAFLILIVAAILTVGTLGIFAWERLDGSEPVRTQTVAFTTIVFFELFLVFALRSPRQTLWRVGPFTNKKLIYAVLLSMALQVMVIYVPVFQVAFHTEPLTALDWARTILVSLSAFLVVEALKLVRQRRAKASSPTEAAPA
ncbi:MAG TPA: calcium-translocating P-type ATPase, SERCA-type [Thermoplasmata archaeon]|nr:calcium-translocating P-type ATPase, SERCA-type [Thermoplasmata archaeon]